MIDAVKSMYANYAKFNGRTNKRDFWLAILGYFLLTFIVAFVGGFIDGFTGSSVGTIIISIFCLASIIPALALWVRRFHDIYI